MELTLLDDYVFNDYGNFKYITCKKTQIKHGPSVKIIGGEKTYNMYIYGKQTHLEYMFRSNSIKVINQNTREGIGLRGADENYKFHIQTRYNRISAKYNRNKKTINTWAHTIKLLNDGYMIYDLVGDMIAYKNRTKRYITKNKKILLYEDGDKFYYGVPIDGKHISDMFKVKLVVYREKL